MSSFSLVIVVLFSKVSLFFIDQSVITLHCTTSAHILSQIFDLKKVEKGPGFFNKRSCCLLCNCSDRSALNSYFQNLPSTYWPPTDHLPTTYRPPTSHLPTTDHLTTDHLTTDHIPTTYCTTYCTTYQPFTNHLPTTYRPHTIHVLTTYWPLFYSAACSQLPWLQVLVMPSLALWCYCYLLWSHHFHLWSYDWSLWCHH